MDAPPLGADNGKWGLIDGAPLLLRCPFFKPMAHQVRNGVQIAKQCWKALNQHPQLLIFPLLSGIALALVTLAIAVPFIANLPEPDATLTAAEESALWWWGALFTFVFYLICYTIIIFANTALVGVSLKLLKGERATVADGVAIAMGRWGQILLFALISATIGTLLQMAKNRDRDDDNAMASVLALVFGSLIQGAWNVIVFFAIPVYVVENRGAIASIRRSADIFKQTWGEGFVGKTVIGGVSCLVPFAIMFVTAAIGFVAVSLSSPVLLALAILFMVLAFGTMALITGAINGIFQASLYHFATTGQAGAFIETDLARAAFARS